MLPPAGLARDELRVTAHNRANSIFDPIVGYGDGTVTERARQRLPAVHAVVDCLGNSRSLGSIHARTSSPLNSSLCLSLRRSGFSIPIASTIVLSGHRSAEHHRPGLEDISGRLRPDHEAQRRPTAVTT